MHGDAVGVTVERDDQADDVDGGFVTGGVQCETTVAPSPASASVRATAKRWTGVRAGRVIEPRNQRFGVPTLSE